MLFEVLLPDYLYLILLDASKSRKFVIVIEIPQSYINGEIFLRVGENLDFAQYPLYIVRRSLTEPQHYKLL